MWTPKRVLILFAGLTACLVSYVLYANFLGNIDGLPPLPPNMLPAEGIQTVSLPTGEPRTDADARLEKAFGAGCEEMRRPLRIWLDDKGIAFAAGEFSIDKKNGSIRLAPFSMALFHKGTARGEHPEISSIKCDIAIITLDQPISQFSQLTNSARKIIAVEMQGGRPGVTIGNNRKSAEKSDDIDILITGGPLFYEDRQKLIWTQGVVCVTDYKTKPATVIRGKGLDMHLARDNSKPRPVVAIAKQDRVNDDSHNVEKLVLRSDVEMHFWVDSRLGFLGGDSKNGKPAPVVVADDAAAAKKAHIHIRSGGSFTYDLTKELARFESPLSIDGKANGGNQLAPDQVHVDRIQTVEKKESRDQLTCDRLELQFRRKGNLGNGAGGKATDEKDIESARAVARSGNDVVLALDTERLAAYGSDFFYRAGDAINGPVTVMKGDSVRTVRSVKDGHWMDCRELHLFGANRLGEGQKVVAFGPGMIKLLDHKNTEKATYPSRVRWRDTLVVEQRKDAGQVFDEITVTGEAAFVDDLQPQKLEAEKIQLWLRNNRESTNRRVDAVGSARQQLTKLEAYDRVRVESPDTIIRRADRLHVVFDHQIAPTLPGSEKHVVGRPVAKDGSGGILPVIGKDEPNKVKTAPGVAAKDKNRKPIELEGNEVVIRVDDFGNKKQLKAMDCRGNVHVYQSGQKTNEKALDITGQLLTLRHFDAGDTLVVHGEKGKFAKIVIGDSTVWGRIVTVNQSTNQADVNGAGAMEMPSNKNLDGSDTVKKNARIRVHWNQNMTFDGRHAYFYGGVMAHEVGAYSKMQCQNMTVILDRPVSFKQVSQDGERKKDEQTAKIDRILCDRNVFIDDAKVDAKGKLQQRNIIMARDAAMDNQAGPTNFAGPGEVRVLAMSSSGLGAAAPADGETKKEATPVWKLTRVLFRDRAFSNTKAATRNATFFGENGGVEVFHFPTIDINAKMDPDNPPKDGLYLRCGILKVDGEQILDRVSQTLVAQQNCFFRSDKYMGTADIIKYDEKNDIIILEGKNGNVVRMFQFVSGGEPTVVATATKVLYNRKTGKIDTEGVRSLTN